MITSHMITIMMPLNGPYSSLSSLMRQVALMIDLECLLSRLFLRINYLLKRITCTQWPSMMRGLCLRTGSFRVILPYFKFLISINKQIEWQQLQ